MLGWMSSSVGQHVSLNLDDSQFCYRLVSKDLGGSELAVAKKAQK